MTPIQRRPLCHASPVLAFLALLSFPLAAPRAAFAADARTSTAFFSSNPDLATFQAGVEAELKTAQQTLDELLALKGKRTVENTITLYNKIMTHAENAAYESHLMESVHPDSTFRARAEGLTQRASKFIDDLGLNRPVYDVLAQVDTKRADPATQYFVSKTLRDFRLAGVDKDETTRKQISSILEELTKTGQEFGRNIRSDSRTVQIDGVADLAGLPEDFIKSPPPRAGR